MKYVKQVKLSKLIHIKLLLINFFILCFICSCNNNKQFSTIIKDDKDLLNGYHVKENVLLIFYDIVSCTNCHKGIFNPVHDMAKKCNIRNNNVFFVVQYEREIEKKVIIETLATLYPFPIKVIKKELLKDIYINKNPLFNYFKLPVSFIVVDNNFKIIKCQ